MHDSNALLVDVRNPGEFSSGHPTGAINIPLTDLASRSDEIPSDRPVLLSCQSGQRSKMAFKQLRDLGLQNVTNVEGGFSAWE
jgi:rhodanese-related sulfurtransferase